MTKLKIMQILRKTIPYLVINNFPFTSYSSLPKTHALHLCIYSDLSWQNKNNMKKQVLFLLDICWSNSFRKI